MMNLISALSRAMKHARALLNVTPVELRMNATHYDRLLEEARPHIMSATSCPVCGHEIFTRPRITHPGPRSRPSVPARYCPACQKNVLRGDWFMGIPVLEEDSRPLPTFILPGGISMAVYVDLPGDQEGEGAGSP